MAKDTTEASQSLAELLGGLGGVLGHLAGVLGVLLVDSINLSVELLAKSLSLLEGGLLVLVHHLTESTTGAGISRVTLVGEVLDTLEVGRHLAVDVGLLLLGGGDLSGHLGELGSELALNLAHSGGGHGDLSGELLAESGNGGRSLLLGLLNVLDSVLEAAVGESSLLGEGLVEVLHRATKVVGGLHAVLGHLLEGLAELRVGGLLGLVHLGFEESAGGSLTLLVGLGEVGGGLGGTLLLGVEGLDGLSLESGDVGTGLLGVLEHLGTVGIEPGVGLLDGLGDGDALRGDGGSGGVEGVGEHLGDSLGVGSDGIGEGLALGSGLGMGGIGLLAEGGHLLGGVLHGDLEVALGNLGGGVDGVHHLLLELLAGLSVLGSELLDRLVGLVAESGDLLLELVVGEPLHVLVHLLATLLDELSALLTLLDGLVDGVLELLKVLVLKSAEGSTTLGRLDGVLVHDTGEVLDLLVGLLVVRLHDLTEAGDLVLELLLGLADGVHGIEAGTTGVSRKLGVLLGTHVGLLLESTPDLAGLLLELLLGVSAVLGELLADAGEGSVEAESHGVDLVVGVLVVLGDGGLELSIRLEVLLVALVAELHHAGHLSVHVGVHLSLGGLVGADDASGLVNVVVHLHHLLLHLGAEGEEADLEAHGGLSDLGSSLGTGTSDVGNSLSVTLVLEGLL